MGKFQKAITENTNKLMIACDLLFGFVFYMLFQLLLIGQELFLQNVVLLLISFGILWVILFLLLKCYGIYKILWKYATVYEFCKCLVAGFFSSVIFILIIFAVSQITDNYIVAPISIYFICALLSGFLPLILRMLYRVFPLLHKNAQDLTSKKKVLLVGAGETGNALIQDIYRDPTRKYDIVCITDDDPGKIGCKMQNILVEGNINDVPKLVVHYNIDLIIIAIPSATGKQIKRITKICAKTKCKIKKVPGYYAMLDDLSEITSQIKDISIEDLLGRDTVDITYNWSNNYCKEKTILVTGAGGSIGSELCRQIAELKPKLLIIADIYENNLYDIQQYLIRTHKDELALVAEIVSIRDKNKLEVLFDKYTPDIVFHAAAHKHVPLMESAPEEAVKNNVFGTLNLARCADQFKVNRFVLISSDKAVNPTNVMGATKRVCEMIIQSMNMISKTDFVAVRFGNVLGSNGSVIPLFKEQISAGGPVTVTHPDIIRYFMTVEEAAKLVIVAGDLAKGGEIFVLDMGQPVKILELAEALIRMSGYEPYKDMNIEFTGLRPGEKLYEELLMDDEGLRKTVNNKIFIASPISVSPESLFHFLDILRPLAENNMTDEIIQKLHELVPTFITRK